MSSKRGTQERVRQKLRTRTALLHAARDLVAAGRTPSLAEVADRALVSRATAYRYFPTQEALLVELPLDLTSPTVASLFGQGAPTDPEDRAALVQNALYDHARAQEAEFRLFLRSSLLRALDEAEDNREPVRGARRVELLDAALAALAHELSDAELRQLRNTLSLLVGVESMVVLRDVLGLDHEEARAVGERAVRAAVRAARRSSRDRG